MLCIFNNKAGVENVLHESKDKSGAALFRTKKINKNGGALDTAVINR